MFSCGLYNRRGMVRSEGGFGDALWSLFRLDDLNALYRSDEGGSEREGLRTEFLGLCGKPSILLPLICLHLDVGVLLSPS